MTIKSKLFIAFTTAIAFIALAIISELIAVDKNTKQIHAGNIRYLSFAIADEFQHKSMNLTRLARTYVATGEQKYWDEYFNIVNWSSGKAPRPKTVDINLYPEQEVSQLDIMKRLNFSEQEFALLEQAGNASNGLIATETQAMMIIKKQQFIKGPFTKNINESLNEFALRILFDQSYHDEVIKIMTPVNKFFSILDSRTKEQLYIASEESNFWLTSSFILQIFVSLIVAIIFLILIKLLFNPLNNILKLITAFDLGNGRLDLTNTLNEKAQPEIAAIAKSFNIFNKSITNVIYEFNQSIDELTNSSKNLHTIAEETELAVNIQQNGLNQVATATQEMVLTVQDITSNALEASVAAKNSDKQARDGLNIIKQAINSMTSLSNEISEASIAIKDLEKDSHTITSILDVIKEIADQTNLLALNAAIEAARAGEQGRGFAVVADEVRSLAQRTQDSTSEIQSMIDNLQRNSEKAVSAMKSSNTQTNLCVENTDKAGQSLTAITQCISEISDMNTQIATASEQQSIVIEGISKNAHTVLTEVQKSSNSAIKTAENSRSMTIVSDKLNGLVAQFKLN